MDDENGSTLLELLGGESALNALVGAFYFGVLADARLSRFFADTNIEKLLRHQKSFLAEILGAQGRYRGGDLRLAHRDLVEKHGLGDGHFDAMVEVLSSTLDRLGYAETLRREVLRRVMGFRTEVLGAQPGTVTSPKAGSRPN